MRDERAVSSQSDGAGKTQRAVDSAAMGLVLAVGFVILHGVIPAAFTADETTVALAGTLLLVAALFQLTDATAMVTSQVLKGAGDTRFTMIAGIATAWLVLVPCAWLFGFRFGWGVVGAWMAFVVEIAVLSVILLVRFVRGRWKAIARFEREQMEV